MKLLTILRCAFSANIFAADRPNVVILYADDMGVGDVSYGEEYARPLRTATVQNTSAGKFALRQGDWVLIDAPSGSGRTESKSYLQHFGLEDYGKDNPGLLFNLKNDPGQSKNPYAKHPEKVESMRTLLKRYVDGEPCAPNKG